MIKTVRRGRYDFGLFGKIGRGLFYAGFNPAAVEGKRDDVGSADAHTAPSRLREFDWFFVRQTRSLGSSMLSFWGAARTKASVCLTRFASICGNELSHRSRSLERIIVRDPRLWAVRSPALIAL
jgi:hypothetical protein